MKVPTKYTFSIAIFFSGKFDTGSRLLTHINWAGWCSGNDIILYLGGVQFGSWPGYLLSWLMISRFSSFSPVCYWNNDLNRPRLELSKSLSTCHLLSSFHPIRSHAACMGELGNAYNILVGKISRRRWKDDINTDLREKGSEGMEWMWLS